jgi:two-component sensor histidine kinase
MERILSATLPIDVDSPAAARMLVGMVGEDLDPEVLRVVALLAHEVVMNSVRHSGLTTGEISVAISRHEHEVGVVVKDGGCGFDPSGPDPSPEGGLGLEILDTLATRWGLTSEEGQTSVWFYVRPPDAPPLKRFDPIPGAPRQ